MVYLKIINKPTFLRKVLDGISQIINSFNYLRHVWYPSFGIIKHILHYYIFAFVIILFDLY